MLRQWAPDEKPPSQEHLLLEDAERLARFREGRRAVHIHLSRLQPYNRRERHLRVALNSFELLVRSFEGHLYLLGNADIVFICRGADVTLIDDAVMRLRYLFQEDPLALEVEGEIDRFCSWYDIEHEYEHFLAAVRRIHADEAKRVRRLAAITSPAAAAPPEPTPIDAQRLAELVDSIVTADLSNLMRRQPVCAIAAGEGPRPVLRELYISIADLRDVVMPGFDLASDRWLFQHLTQTLDRRMLKMLIKNDDSDLTRAFSLNLNVATLVSPDFLAFDASLRTGARGTIVIELQMVDVFADLRAFAFARDFVKERGYRVCLDAIDDLSLPFIDRERLDIDLVKLAWQPGMTDRLREDGAELRADIERLGRARAILCHCDAEEAIEFGEAVGINLFQGRQIDKMLAAKRTPHRSYFRRPAALAR
jgi:hypothetical protein